MARYWFRRRRYGYGAAPVTWEGWTMTVVCCVLVAGSIIVMQLTVAKSNFVAWMIWAAAVAAVTFGFVGLARSRTDGEWRWQWGDDPDAPNR